VEGMTHHLPTDAARCTGTGCPLKDSCVRHLVYEREREDPPIGVTVSMTSPVEGEVGELCRMRHVPQGWT
jgi:hypothetical protein